jgi:hypothetical protein
VHGAAVLGVPVKATIKEVTITLYIHKTTNTMSLQRSLTNFDLTNNYVIQFK